MITSSKKWVGMIVMFLGILFFLSGYTVRAADEVKEDLSGQNVIEGKNYLLYGYNALDGSYINTTNTGSKPILEEAKVDLNKADTSAGDTDFYYEKSIYELYERFALSVDIGFKGVAFSGKAKAEFTTTKNATENRLYIRYMKNFFTYDIANETPINKLNETLSKGFVDDVKLYYKTNPKLIFDTYGTHLITQYYTGGRLDLNFTYNNKDQVSEVEIMNSVSASYGKISGSGDVSNISKASLIETSSTLKCFSTGGTTEAQISGTSIQEVANGFQRWKSSIDAKPDICGVKKGSLIPIWDLFSDKDIKESLRLAYEKEVEKKALGLRGLDQGPITDIIAIYGNSYEEAERQLEPGYYIVQAANPSNDDRPNLDANHYGKGKFIFIAYTYKSVFNEQKKLLNPIVDFKVVRGKDVDVPNSQKVPLDLNKGQGGPYLYLYFRRATDEEYNNKDTLYITSLRGYYKKDYNVPSNWFTKKDSLELNTGIKNRDGKDNYTNLMYQNGYRYIAEDGMLKDNYDEQPILALSEIMQVDEFDISKPEIDSEEDVYEYEEGDIIDPSEEELKPEEETAEEEITEEETAEEEITDEIIPEEEAMEEGLLGGAYYNSDTSEVIIVDGAKEEEGLLLVLPKTGEGRNAIPMLTFMMGISLLGIFFLGDRKKSKRY